MRLDLKELLIIELSLSDQMDKKFDKETNKLLDKVRNEIDEKKRKINMVRLWVNAMGLGGEND